MEAEEIILNKLRRMDGQLDVDRIEKMIKYMGLVGVENKNYDTDPAILGAKRQKRVDVVLEAELNQFYRELFPTTFTEPVDVYVE